MPGNLTELIRSFDMLPVLPEINALQSRMLVLIPKRRPTISNIRAGMRVPRRVNCTDQGMRSTFRRYMITNNDDVVNALGKVSDLKRVHSWVQSPKLGEIEQFEDRPKMAVNS